jgi:hypothetical protein
MHESVIQRQGWESDDTSGRSQEPSHCVQLEVAESYEQNARRKVRTPQAAWAIANGRALEHHVPICSVCYKFSHCQHHLHVLHAEHNLPQANFKLVTVYVAVPCTDPFILA